MCTEDDSEGNCSVIRSKTADIWLYCVITKGNKSETEKLPKKTASVVNVFVELCNYASIKRAHKHFGGSIYRKFLQPRTWAMSKGKAARNGKDFNFHNEVEKSSKYQVSGRNGVRGVGDKKISSLPQQGIKHRMGESQDSFLTQDTQNERDAQKKCCQCSNKTLTISASVSLTVVLALVVFIIRFQANVRPDEKYASVGTIPFPAVTICPGIRSGYPKNNFNRTLFMLQTETAPKLRPRKYEGHYCSDRAYFFKWPEFGFQENCTRNTVSTVRLGYL